MLCSLIKLVGYRIRAIDGQIGSVDDFLFEDDSWAVRYLVARTGSFLHRHKVLLSPAAFGRPDPAARSFGVDLTVQQIQGSPDIDTEQPVSRRQEAELHRHYQLMPYWFPATGFGAVPTPLPEPAIPADALDRPEEDHAHANLRSAREVIGYDIATADGTFGSVSDFIADTGGWVLPYVAIDTGVWLPGRKILIPCDRVVAIDWDDRTVRVAVEDDALRHAPAFDPSLSLSREDETVLRDYYDLYDRAHGRG